MPGAAGAAGTSSFFSAITHSVVKNMPAIDAASGQCPPEPHQPDTKEYPLPSVPGR